MLRSLKELRRFQLAANDGTIGRVKDFLFDDSLWAIRFMVADTGTWLPGRKVLIPTGLIGEPGSVIDHQIPVDLRKDQIEHSPGLEEAEPVSRQREREQLVHYGQHLYWTEPMDPLGAHAEMAEERSQDSDEDAGDRAEEDDGVTQLTTHLRSSEEVRSYTIAATDDTIGHVEELIADTRFWVVRYMVVDTRSWLPGRKVLISPTWCTSVSWSERAVVVDLTREQVKSSPEYDPAMPVNRELEARLYDFYGRPTYWS